jgi:hypothetical protein
MAQDLFQYDKMVETALRGVMRDALARVARDGLRGGHHFYITFRTGAAGVVLPPQLLVKFPEEMTIVLQHQFWGLEAGDGAFSVSLSFNGRMERLTIPLAAVTTFADPSVKFGLQFEVPAAAAEPAPGSVPAPLLAMVPAADKAEGDKAEGDKSDADKTGAGKTAADKTGSDKADADKTGGGKTDTVRPAAEIVTLDRFRKR